MKIKVIFLFLYLLFSLNSCSVIELLELLLLPNKEEKITFEEASRRVDLYWAITVYNVDDVKRYLEEGYDPNKCSGEGWYENNPLNVVARNFYNTYARLKSGKEISDPPPDVEIIQLLVNAGADVNQRPYIWCKVYIWDNSIIESIINRINLSRTARLPETEEEIAEYKKEKEEEPLFYVNDANRVIEALLKAGADPDMLGHPYPYSLKAKRKGITDEEAEKYFAKGTRPINEAIKKGIRWESQVDLLLQYTTLDKDSLKAAKESKDPAMIEKITKLWKEQNGG